MGTGYIESNRYIDRYRNVLFLLCTGIAPSTGTGTTTSRPTGADTNRGTKTDTKSGTEKKSGTDADAKANANANANANSELESGTGYIERLWGFMSVKDGLRSRLRSHTSRERDEHTQQATNLSLAYNFLTPLTGMAVERPQVLADGTLAQEAPPTEAPAAATGAGTANELPAEEEQVGGAPSSSQSLTRKKDQPEQSSKVAKATGEWENKLIH